MDLNQLTAISPIDGRYRKQLHHLDEYFSEYALIKYRVLVEVEYFLFLAEKKFFKVTAGVKTHLLNAAANFSLEDAGVIKETEKITNHDVKAVEYFLKAELDKVPSMDGLELASVVSTREPYFVGDPNSKIRVAVLDYGIKKNILNCFTESGVYVNVHNAKTSYQELKAFNAGGYFISNGPGDPAPMGYAVETIKEIIADNKPVFGICLGHQLLALANDIPTFKMHHGHRGLNHPVKNIISGKSEITTQNHGFGVDPIAVRASNLVEITHLNLNDESIEGIRMKEKSAFSVQYHPEATPGPHDSRYLFDEFIAMINQNDK